MEKASEVSFKLNDLRMTKSVFELVSSESADEFETHLGVSAKISKTKKTIVIFVDVNVDSKSKSGNNIFTIQTRFMGSFSFEGEPNDLSLESFAKGNGPGIVYPFSRSAIANISIAASVPLIKLPIVNFFKIPVQIEFED